MSKINHSTISDSGPCSNLGRPVQCHWSYPKEYKIRNMWCIWLILTLKTESSWCQQIELITGATDGCHNNNHRCHQWQQSWHQEKTFGFPRNHNQTQQNTNRVDNSRDVLYSSKLSGHAKFSNLGHTCFFPCVMYSRVSTLGLSWAEKLHIK